MVNKYKTITPQTTNPYRAPPFFPKMDLEQFFDEKPIFRAGKQKPIEDDHVGNIFALLLFTMFQLSILRNWNSPKDGLTILFVELILVCHIYIGYQLAQSM